MVLRPVLPGKVAGSADRFETAARVVRLTERMSDAADGAERSDAGDRAIPGHRRRAGRP
ncbi:hypothetical protein [Streptomyces sp. I6]|uniref:hypothetical protein n=1 Tax=Streptomyces sp. I6 TaxID=2483113 RepID=UPI0016113B75|nr:hypothetical protein [Streptomyces sp. I6]